MHDPAAFKTDDFHNELRERFLKTFGLEDTSALETFVLLQRVSHLSRLLDDQLDEGRELSGPRWRLLMRLLVEEQNGNTEGLTPTMLSRWQHVTKNTISALLRGLESQGLIQRTLVPSDLRAFRIRLTPAGREYLYANAGQRLQNLQQIFSDLDPRELEQLITLLNKLHRSLSGQVHLSIKDPIPDLPVQKAEE